MQKTNLKNRENKNIVALVEEASNPVGLAFVMHGLGGYKEQKHIVSFAEAFAQKGFTVVRFDTTNTVGESDGRYEDATLTNYADDLSDVIEWASKQSWYREPFVLCGHSLGAISSASYAQRNPEKVLALAPISPVVSGQLSLASYGRYRQEELATWQGTGWRVEESKSKPGVVKRLPWSHMIDRLKHDLLPEARKLTMPVLLIVGDDDTVTPPEDVKIFFDALPGKKEFHLIAGAEHTFREPEHLSEIKAIFLEWIDKVTK